MGKLDLKILNILLWGLFGKMEILNGNFRHYELNNGLVVALQETPTQTIVGEVRVNYGAFHEQAEEGGYAHLLEHCLASAGSDKYTPLQVEAISDGLGYFNANTNVGRTTFSMGSLTEETSISGDTLPCCWYSEIIFR